jgi:hypothetical protein
MKRLFAILVLSMAGWHPAGAADALPGTATISTLKITTEALRSPREPSRDLDAALRGDDRLANLLRAPAAAEEQVSDRCKDPGASLCYDTRTRKFIYKPMRRFLPEIPGMTPHNLALSRNKITASYTFK